MSNEMTEKYQKHYNDVLTGTLNDTMMKNVSYRANINLANEIISEQEKTIQDLKSSNEEMQKEVKDLKSNKSSSENTKISSLENTVKSHLTTISNLNNELNMANRIKNDYDSLKGQVSNVETFRMQLVKEREAHQMTRLNFEKEIEELKLKIETLENPPKKKRIKPQSLVNIMEIETSEIQEETPLEALVKDGGTF